MDLNLNYCKCGAKKSYSDEYDAYYCNSCQQWLEDKCSDPTCEFCANRPTILAIGDNDDNAR